MLALRQICEDEGGRDGDDASPTAKPLRPRNNGSFYRNANTADYDARRRLLETPHERKKKRKRRRKDTQCSWTGARRNNNMLGRMALLAALLFILLIIKELVTPADGKDNVERGVERLCGIMGDDSH